MTIYLIRHGVTAANEQHRYCGSTDLPLSDRGREALIPGSITPPPGARYLSSGMRRCNETLSLLFGPVPYAVCPGFREIDFGAFEMQTYEELKDDHAYQIWLSGNNEANPTPGGESGSQMTARAMAAFRDIQRAGQDTVIVTHGGVIAAIMASLFPGEGKNRYQWQPRPGEGYAITDASYAMLP